MNRLFTACCVLLSLVLVVVALAPQLGSAEAQANRPLDLPRVSPTTYFDAVPVVIDPQGQPLAAYQFELTSPNAKLTIVGLENGGHPAFSNAPFYDTDAVAKGEADRVVVAAYSLLPAGQLPHKPTRVATVMVQVQLDADAQPGDQADYQLKLIAAGSPAGEPIPATLFRGVNP